MLLINGLVPYITVIQIGDKTVGKNVGSITLYDSPNFTKSNANPRHKYAMQPLVLKTANKSGFGDYQNGLSPNTNNILIEDIGNLGVLGTANEPLLQKALDLISFRIRAPRLNQSQNLINANPDSEQISEMYLEKTPKGFSEIFK